MHPVMCTCGINKAVNYSKLRMTADNACMNKHLVWLARPSHLNARGTEEKEQSSGSNGHNTISQK